jgi:hypothetical protein
MTDIMIPDWLEPVDMLVPPPNILEVALLSGHDPTVRFIAFFWEPGGDEARFYDGRIGADAHWPAYLAWIRLGPNDKALSPYQLGDSERPAKHYLVLDRQERKCYCAPAGPVRHWLMDQHELPLPLDGVPEEDLEDVLRILQQDLQRQLQQIQSPTMEQVYERLEQDHQRTLKLKGWLAHQFSLRNENYHVDSFSGLLAEED